MPTPTPTAAQIEQVTTAIITESIGNTTALVGNLTNEQWTATLADLVKFADVQFKYSHLNGQIAGYVTDNNAKRLAIRNSIRARLGLPQLADENGTIIFGTTGGGIFNFNTTGQWF